MNVRIFINQREFQPRDLIEEQGPRSAYRVLVSTHQPFVAVSIKSPGYADTFIRFDKWIFIRKRGKTVLQGYEVVNVMDAWSRLIGLIELNDENQVVCISQTS